VEYIRWSDSSCNDLLWVSADPGCGKSVLARSIVDDGLEASGSVRTFCYFFFKNNEEQNHLAVALCSVLHQLFSRRPQLLRYAIPSWEKNGKKLQQEVDELWRIFTMAALSDTSCKTICIFDALDECCDNNQGRLIEKLQSSHRSQHPLEQDTWLEFLVTSRPYSHIQDRFRVVTDSFPHLHLKGEEENDQINEEINRVVKIKVKDLAKSAQLTRDIQRQLEAKLLRMKHRTYLWLYLAMEDIRDTFADSLRPAEESIQLIPPSVEAAYQNILSRVRPAQQAKVNMILQIIAAARRPLTISEMAVALSLAMPPRGPRTLQTELETNGLGTKLRRLCGLFVYIHNSKVYLIHETAKEFLLGDLPCHTTLPSCHHWGNSITNRDAHATLARVCVIHLESFNDESTISDPDGETSQCLQNEVFLDYSAQNWNFHFSLAEFSQDDDISFRAMRLCDPNLQVFSIWWSFLRTTDPITHSNMPVPPTSLIISSWFGHQGIVGLILKRGIKSHFELELPLSIAVVRGNQAVTELLLENNAYHELGTAGCTSPLEYVVRNGNMALLELLLQCGANVNPKTSVHPLQIAARSGNLAVVNLLLNKGADPKSLDRVGPPRDMLTPLSIAAAREHTAIVKLLLKNGAETDPKKCKHPLFCAAENGYVAVVEALLQKGVSPDLEYNGQTPLSRAAESGHSEVISLLIDKGDAQADSQDSNGRTPLSWAACNGHVEAVKLLLSTQSVNPDSKDHGRIHLSNAAKAGYREIIKIFRERGVIIKATSNGRTPLSYAAGNGNEEVVKLLLENEAVDPNSEDSKGLTPLAYARKSNHGKVVELLLSRGGREGF
jgi:ankyrin repeat protein